MKPDVNTTCAEEEEFSGHDLAKCGGFVIFPHFLHRSLSLLDLFPLLPLAPDLESELLCEKPHLSPSSASALGKVFTRNRCAVCAFVVTCGTLSRSSRAVVETGVCVQYRPSGGLAFDGRVQFSWIVRRKQIVHVVEVSDFARDRLQGMHHCFFGWRTSSCLQFREVCEPLSQHQQQLRLVSARDGLGKRLVKRCRVLRCARKDLFVQHSQVRAA